MTKTIGNSKSIKEKKRSKNKRMPNSQSYETSYSSEKYNNDEPCKFWMYTKHSIYIFTDKA